MATLASDFFTYGAEGEAEKIKDERVQRLPFFDAYNRARLLQFMELGGDPSQLRIGSQAFRKMDKKDRLRIGPKGKKGERYRAPTVEDLRGAARARQRRDIQDERETFRELQNSPLFDSLLGDAQGTTARFAESVAELGRRSLGGAAAAGLNLRDPGVQARVLGQNALQGMLAQRGLQRQAGMTGLSLTRGPGSTAGMNAPRGLGAMQNLVFNQFGADLGAQQYNVGNRIQFHAMNAAGRMQQKNITRNFMQNLFGTLAGGGGGGGGAQQPPQYQGGQYSQPYYAKADYGQPGGQYGYNYGSY